MFDMNNHSNINSTPPKGKSNQKTPLKFPPTNKLKDSECCKSISSVSTISNNLYLGCRKDKSKECHNHSSY